MVTLDMAFRQVPGGDHRIMGTAIAPFSSWPVQLVLCKMWNCVRELSRNYMGQTPCSGGYRVLVWVDKPQEVGTQGAPELFFCLSSLSLFAVGWP